jgi:serine/threonine-protein kinase
VQLVKDTLIEKFRVTSRLGSGAMGEVFLATDESLGRKVALKILSETHRDNPELRARFVREARAVAAISHPNVVQVFATGEWDGRPYLVMELLGGQDLATLVRKDGPLPSRRAAAIVADAAKGLAAAARAGLMHRDVKPSNIMLLPDGTVKVTDFGLAKPMDPGDDPGLTALGVVVGTPDYIAPEQARGEEIDQRVDIYALGCTLFFLLTGRPPYRKSLDDDEKYLKVVARHLRDPVPDPHVERPDTDDELAELQAQMMAKSPDDRPSYDAVIARLARVDARLATAGEPRRRDARQVSTRPIDTSAPPRPSASVATAAPSEQTHKSLQLPASGEAGVGASDGSVGSSVLAAVGLKPTPWLVGVTAASALIFLVGLGLLLFGPMPSRPAPLAAPVPDAGPARADAAVLVDVARLPPAGMLLVPAEGKRPAFYVDRAPVSNKAYAEFKPTHKFAAKAADQPVTGVSYDYAAEYARFRGGRLVRVGEFDAAAAVPSFVPAGMRLFEWVDDGDETAATQNVRGVNGASSRKKAAGDATVTFRIAKDL